MKEAILYRCVWIILILFFSPRTFASVCDRSEKVKFKLEEALKKPCNQISNVDLLGVISLHLNFAGIKRLKEGDFLGLDNVEILGLAGNQLEYLPRNIFRPLVSLRKLFLHDNPFKELRKISFGQHPKLEIVEISMNRFDLRVDGNLLSGTTPHLKYLVLKDVRYIPKNLLRCARNISELQIYFEEETIGTFNYKVMGGIKLPLVSIVGKRIKELPSDFFHYLRHISALNLVLTSLESIDPHIFRSNKYLRELSLKLKSVQFVPPNLFDTNVNLQNLSLSIAGDQNVIISKELTKKLTKLKYLYFMDSGFSEVNLGAFDHLLHLEELAVMSTQVLALPYEIIYKLRYLRNLILGFNQLEYIDPRMINPSKISPLIQEVFIAGNPLSEENIDELKATLPNKVNYYSK